MYQQLIKKHKYEKEKSGLEGEIMTILILNYSIKFF